MKAGYTNELCSLPKNGAGGPWGAARELVSFPILSDFATRKVMADYGVLLSNLGMANRTTFVIDKDGKIVHIEEGSGAIDPSGAEMACSKLAHK